MRVVFEKVDLDTCLVAYLFGVLPDDDLVVYSGELDMADLYNGNILCIEVGGSGQVDLLNFDHHDINMNLPPACVQAYEYLRLNDDRLLRLVEYVSAIDTAKPLPKVSFPSLSSVFSGMLLTEKDPRKQLLLGMDIVRTVYEQKLDPFDTMPLLPKWLPYIEAKRQEREAVMNEIKSKAQFFYSSGGLKVGSCELTHHGGAKLLYSMGADVIILFNPEFGERRIRKFTIGTTGASLARVFRQLNEVDPGWGGRDTIIGSPKNRSSSLTPEKVLNIVLSNL